VSIAAWGRLPAERTLRQTAAGLAVVGLAVATYIAIADASSGAPVCLAGGHGCETVANSHYSHLLGVNVALFGIAGYLLILAATFVPGDPGRLAAFALATIGFGFSMYLTYLELFVIDAICQWCVASAVLMTALFVVNATRAFGYAGSELAAGQPRSQGTSTEGAEHGQ
jgi:uncharacterized membrane protein